MDDAFDRELMQRSPLAACVLEMSDFAFDDQLLASIWSAHRGRCYDRVLRFPEFLRLMRDALVRHGGSAHHLFRDLTRRDAAPPVDDSNFYRKLAHMPPALSRALLSGCTQRLAQLMPDPPADDDDDAAADDDDDGSAVPGCFDEFDAYAGDGKQVKQVAKRLEPTRGFDGALVGAKALVALDLRRGLAVAMSDTLDGMANDVPLVPLLVPQLHALTAEGGGGGGGGTGRPMLTVWDRQFDDLRTMALLASRPGDAFVVRVKQTQTTFVVESTVETRDALGRPVRDEVGVLTMGGRSMRLRRITLFRGGGGGGGGSSSSTATGKAKAKAKAKGGDEDDEDVVLLTNLLDRAAYPADDLLRLYRKRWDIEQVFQQVTETFSLSHLIGCSPQATLLQFAFCLLLHNLMQVVRAYVAADGGVLAAAVSMYYLFDDARTELSAWAYHTDGTWPRARRDAAAMRRRLRELLTGAWDPRAYAKAADKRPRGKPPPRQRLHGGHTSVQRALDGNVRVIKQ